jgi:hypothetical protein
VRLTASILVPGSANGQDGILDAAAEAVQPGAAGNIQSGAINSPCCGGQVVVSNPRPFSGGSDGGVTHQVSQDDLNSVKNQLAPGLRQQAAQQLNSQLQANEVQAGSPQYKVSATSDQPVGTIANQVTVTVTVIATVVAYNAHIASDLASQLLTNEAAHSSSAGPGYQLRGTLNVSPPTVKQQANAGQLTLSVSASGLWAYTFSATRLNQLAGLIAGKSPAAARTFLLSQPGVADVQIPTGSNTLPAASSIQIRVQLP